MHFWPKLGFFFFLKIFQLDKFEGADFKYDNTVLTWQSKLTQISIFGFKFKYFCFFRKILQLDKFEGADFNYSFQIPSQKYRNKAFLLQNLGIFVST